MQPPPPPEFSGTRSYLGNNEMPQHGKVSSLSSKRLSNCLIVFRGGRRPGMPCLRGAALQSQIGWATRVPNRRRAQFFFFFCLFGNGDLDANWQTDRLTQFSAVLASQVVSVDPRCLKGKNKQCIDTHINAYFTQQASIPQSLFSPCSA